MHKYSPLGILNIKAEPKQLTFVYLFQTHYPSAVHFLASTTIGKISDKTKRQYHLTGVAPSILQLFYSTTFPYQQ